MPTISLGRALADPNLFARHFRNKSWAGWKTFLRALFAEPPGPDDLEIYRARTGRTAWPAAAFAEAAVIVGRRGGKSRILALIAVYLAAFRDYAPYLAPGEVATIGVLAVDKGQARAIFRFVIGLLRAVPMLEPLIVKRDTETIELSNRVVIEIATASFRSTRGYSYAAVLCDEVAFWRSDETSLNPDVEILRALRPGLATIPGSMLLIASSPYSQRGELYNAFRRHFGRDDARVLVWKASTAEMNPSIDKRIIDEAYEDDPESAKAEYGGEFRTDLADFVSRETIDAVVMWGRCELPPEPGVTYSGFVDPSGGVSDSMTLAIGHLGRNNACVLDAAVEIRPPLDPEQTVAEFAALLRRYGVSKSSATNTAANGRALASPSTASNSSNRRGRRATSTVICCPCSTPVASNCSTCRACRPSSAGWSGAPRARAAIRSTMPRRPRRFGQCGRWRAGGRRFRPPAAAGQA